MPRRQDVRGAGRAYSVRRLCVFATVLALVNPLAAAQRVADEFRLKAAFLFRFPEFVEWPTRVLEGRTTIDVCVLAPNPFGNVLEQLIEGEALSGRKLVVRHIDDVADSCHLLYVPQALPGRKALLRRIAASPILTVSDAPRFLDEGGIVQLTLVQNRVRFEVSATAAERAGLKLSAQLLRLAINVREERP